MRFAIGVNLLMAAAGVLFCWWTQAQALALDGLVSGLNAIAIMVTNPVDVLTYRVWQKTGWPRERVLGQAGPRGLRLRRLGPWKAEPVDPAVEAQRLVFRRAHAALLAGRQRPQRQRLEAADLQALEHLLEAVAALRAQ